MSAGLSPTDPLLGRVLAERYQILHRLGEGAMGVVYKARHVRVGRLLAVKVLHARALLDSKVAQRFAREAELAGRLRHPNVIGVVDVGEVDGTRYMVMDYVEGPDLARLLDEAPMPAERIIRLVRQMLDGLHHAHEQGMIHRDFKPENVIVERDRQGGESPRIVDFGIALLREGSDSPDGQGRLTTNGLVLGTPHYMAPEQAVADPIDHRIDLFALGIVVYEMLSGRLPFDGSGAEVARANLLLDPPPINKRVPHLEVDPLLEAFSRRLMAKKRNARPATAKAARELLDLIDRDRSAAAPLLGVPVARSGRTPAVTEPVDAGEASGATQSPETTRMKPTPTPRAADPVAPARAAAAPSEPRGPDELPWGEIGATASPVGFPVGGEAGWSPPAGEPSWGPPGSATDEPSWASQGDAAASAALGGGAPVPPIAPGMAYHDHLARPPGGGYGAPRRPPHRDTALRTPLGWQSSSLPGRRRSWLIGGAVLGTACVLAAAVVITVWTDRADPVASDSIFSGDRRPPAAPPAPVAAAAPTVAGAPSSDVGAVAAPAAPGDVGAAAAAAPGDVGAAAAA
ncbi:MAG TPA: protein kinase, partial [Kofleriaceae bacterium]|nr:protein kinase [Kofleriaceae bacterium]